MILAHYSQKWVNYILNTESQVYREDLDEDDFLVMTPVFSANLAVTDKNYGGHFFLMLLYAILLRAVEKKDNR